MLVVSVFFWEPRAVLPERPQGSCSVLYRRRRSPIQTQALAPSIPSCWRHQMRPPTSPSASTGSPHPFLGVIQPLPVYTSGTVDLETTLDHLFATLVE